MVHTPKRAAHKIEQGIGLDSSSERTTGYKAEAAITVGPKRLPDSLFPKRLSQPHIVDLALRIEK